MFFQVILKYTISLSHIISWSWSLILGPESELESRFLESELEFGVLNFLIPESESNKNKDCASSVAHAMNYHLTQTFLRLMTLTTSSSSSSS